MNRDLGDWTWPDLGEPELIERMSLDQDSFHELWVSLVRQMPRRPYSREAFKIGTGYPWPRPDGSFVLSDGEGRLLADMDPDRRASLLEELTGADSGRTPMMAIGSNGSPEGLWRKFAHFEDPADRTLLAVAGQLHDFDIGAAAELAMYGAMPATIFPSPDTRVRSTAVWLTEAQLTQLAWAEIPYWLGRLDTTFESEAPVSELGFEGFGSFLVFVNRFGSFAPDGEPIALAAVPAEKRTTPERTQIDLLQMLADTVYDGELTAEQLVRQTFEDLGEVGPTVASALRSNSIPFESDRWTPYPGSA